MPHKDYRRMAKKQPVSVQRKAAGQKDYVPLQIDCRHFPVIYAPPQLPTPNLWKLAEFENRIWEMELTTELLDPRLPNTFLDFPQPEQEAICLMLGFGELQKSVAGSVCPCLRGLWVEWHPMAPLVASQAKQKVLPVYSTALLKRLYRPS